MDKTRRNFLAGMAICAGGGTHAASAAFGSFTKHIGDVQEVSSDFSRLRTGGSANSNDPWVEIDAAAFRNNVREVSRMAGGCADHGPGQKQCLRPW